MMMFGRSGVGREVQGLSACYQYAGLGCFDHRGLYIRCELWFGPPGELVGVDEAGILAVAGGTGKVLG